MTLQTYNIIATSVLAFNYYYSNLYETQDKNDFLDKNNLDVSSLKYPPMAKEYDYIVVGAGSAGCVVASKLAERNHHVLLLDAGGDQIPYSYPLGLNDFLREEDQITFKYKSEHQPDSFGFENGITTMTVGRVLGGSSTINGMVYNRGHPKDYDNWATLTGDSSWRYENITKFFRMSENFKATQNSNLGNDGPIPLYMRENNTNAEETFFMGKWNAAGKELNYDTELNFNDPQREGFGTVLHNRAEASRVSNFDAFIKPVLEKGKNNLVIERYSNVEKIDITTDENGEGKANGVIYMRHNIMQMARAKKEIIISAGTFNSPLILMKSGIGSRADLEENEIPVVKDLPVGRYRDHPSTVIYGLKYNKHQNSQVFLNSTIEQIELSSYDPFGRVMGMSHQAMLSSTLVTDNWPNIQIERYVNAEEILKGGDDIGIGITNERPKSVGYIKYSKNSILPNNAIWSPNVLSDPAEEDIKVIIDGIRILEKLLNTTAMKEIGVTWDKEIYAPEHCKPLRINTDGFWDCYIRHFTYLSWHPVGSCHMGSSQTNSVVDSKLKVWGIQGLRVIDNSIQPAIVNTNTNAAATMIGQFGVDAILIGDPGNEDPDPNQPDSSTNLNLSSFLFILILILTTLVNYKNS